jgi:class 3 adenylate cyclase/pimeloyl-ACP methyl ester carboxylesterase
VKTPPIQFADGPEGKIAYQTMGDGPIDLVLVPFMGRWNLDIVWEDPRLERYLSRLASFSRLILFNHRGTGLSDPLPSGTRLIAEEAMEEVRRVIDEVGSDRAAVLAMEFAGPMAALFAATFPERTRAVVLLNCVATLRREDDYPWGFPPDVFKKFNAAFVANWGTGRNLDFMAADLAGDERFRQWFARLERLSMSQGGIASRIGLWDEGYTGWDARGVLPAIQAPTLVMSHTEVPWVRLGHSRYLADHIPGARYVERPGYWGVFWHHDVDWTLDEIQAFLTGTRGAPGPEDRVLATVLFTDIVASTQRAAAIGDERWRILLDEHDALVRRETERFRGRAVKSTGDGFLATFDGPARAIRCALAMQEAVRELGIEVRTGLHTGEVELRGDDVGGIAVHIGERVMAAADPGDVIVSSAVPPLVAGAGIEFDDRGMRALKGVPGEWRLFAVKTQADPSRSS